MATDLSSQPILLGILIKMGENMSIYYDEEGDYLTIFVGESGSNYGEDVAEGVTIFRDNQSNKIIGIGIMDFRTRTRNLEEIQLKLPFSINFSLISKQ